MDHAVAPFSDPDGGFRWQGWTCTSLSAVAFAIMGVKRNGPAFFGLREKATAQ